MSDPVRTFMQALTPTARYRLRAPGAAVIAAIHRAADEGHDLEHLAHVVGAGIGRYTPVNAPELMLFRLRRATETPEGTA